MSDTQAAFSLAESFSASLYVLADPLQNSSLPHALAADSNRAVCLFDGGADVQAHAPYLVQVDRAQAESTRAWLDQYGPQSPCATFLASRLPLASLAAHLKQFLDVVLPDQTPMVLAFWDANILAALVGAIDDDTLHVKGPVFANEQRQAFLGPILRWWYWDRNGMLRRLDWNQDEVRNPGSSPRAPLNLEQEQVDALIEASEPDGLLNYYAEHIPDLLNDLPERERYGFVRRQIERAQHYGVTGSGNLMSYCYLALMYGESFDEHPSSARLLTQVRSGDLTIDQLAQQLRVVLQTQSRSDSGR